MTLNLQDFANYFEMQWINGSFANWSIWNSAPGIAGTNNALESFNNVLKRTYTQRIRHSIPTLLGILINQVLRDCSFDLTGRKT
jgi:hypothetical protein